MTFYDLHGKPISYLSDGGLHIYLFNGKPVAYLYQNAVYGYNGHQLGWFENGWVRDLNGYCVFFCEIANGSGPAKPTKGTKPAKRPRRAKPTKCARQAKSAKASKRASWSKLSGEQFFVQ